MEKGWEKGCKGGTSGQQHCPSAMNGTLQLLHSSWCEMGTMSRAAQSRCDCKLPGKELGQVGHLYRMATVSHGHFRQELAAPGSAQAQQTSGPCKCHLLWPVSTTKPAWCRWTEGHGSLLNAWAHPYVTHTPSSPAQLHFPARASQWHQEGAGLLTPKPFVVYLYPALCKQLASACPSVSCLSLLCKLAPGSPRSEFGSCSLPP